MTNTSIRKNTILTKALLTFNNVALKIFVWATELPFSDFGNAQIFRIEERTALNKFWLKYPKNGSKGDTNSIWTKWMWQWSQMLLEKVCLCFISNRLWIIIYDYFQFLVIAHQNVDDQERKKREPKPSLRSAEIEQLLLEPLQIEVFNEVIFLRLLFSSTVISTTIQTNLTYKINYNIQHWKCHIFH